MRVLVGRKARAELSVAVNQRAGDGTSLFGAGISLLNRIHDQRADRSAGTFGPAAQPVMQRLGNIDCGANRHDIIMASATGNRKIPVKVTAAGDA